MNTLLYKIRWCAYCMLTCLCACDDFVRIEPPRTDLVRSTIFESNETAEAAMADIYYQLATSGFASGTGSSISFYGALCADEMINYRTDAVLELTQINNNSLEASNELLARLWSDLYNTVYKTNAMIEGLNEVNKITLGIRNRLEGEARFVRAFAFFYLTNLWGDVPLTLTTNYQINDNLRRTPEQEVYQQIILDLETAKKILPSDYSFSANERVRASAMAASALLARTYLFTGEWANAEIEASAIIENELYQLEPALSNVYRTTSKEAIFQLWSRDSPNEWVTFLVHPLIGPVSGALQKEFVDSFETSDQRATIWIGNVSYQGETYSHSTKYASPAAPPEDYSTVLRLAEQYLIRAEARTQLNKILDAQEDLNRIRFRAGLANTSASDKATLLLAVEQERKSEFFAEWGHRWFDLKRTGRADVILGPIKEEWNSNDILFPIPEIQLINNPSLTQNPK